MLLQDREDQESEVLEEINDVLLQMIAPLDLRASSAGNAAAGLLASMETTGIELERHGVIRPSELSVYAFYSRVLYLRGKPVEKE